MAKANPNFVDLTDEIEDLSNFKDYDKIADLMHVKAIENHISWDTYWNLGERFMKEVQLRFREEKYSVEWKQMKAQSLLWEYLFRSEVYVSASCLILNNCGKRLLGENLSYTVVYFYFVALILLYCNSWHRSILC
jgi:hypothetical protein